MAVQKRGTRATSVSGKDMTWIKDKLTEMDVDLKLLKQTTWIWI